MFFFSVRVFEGRKEGNGAATSSRGRGGGGGGHISRVCMAGHNRKLLSLVFTRESAYFTLKTWLTQAKARAQIQAQG